MSNFQYITKKKKTEEKSEMTNKFVKFIESSLELDSQVIDILKKEKFLNYYAFKV